MCEMIFKALYSLTISYALVISLDNISLKKIKKYYFVSPIIISVFMFVLNAINKLEISVLCSFLLLCILAIKNMKGKFYGIFVSSISMLICLLSYYISSFIADLLTHEQTIVLDILSNEFIFTIIGMFFLTIILSHILGSIFKILNINEEIFQKNSTNKIIIWIIYFIICITAILDTIIFIIIGNATNLTIVLTFRNINKIVILLNVLFILAFFTFNAVILHFNNRNFEAKMKKEYEEREITQLREYTKMIESLSDDLRSFKHDYSNIMEAMGAYIQDENLEGLKEFYSSELIEAKRVFNKSNKGIFMLKNLKIDSIKGLISSKVIKAERLNIDTHIEILDEIKRINMKEIDICRIIGIFLDNAIEAQEGLDNPFINIYVINKENSIVIVINNKCSEDTPPIFKIFDKGFSSKGNNRGIGLSNVKKLLDERYENVFLSTKIKDCIFTHEMIIKKD